MYACMYVLYFKSFYYICLSQVVGVNGYYPHHLALIPTSDMLC